MAATGGQPRPTTKNPQLGLPFPSQWLHQRFSNFVETFQRPNKRGSMPWISIPMVGCSARSTSANLGFRRSRMPTMASRSSPVMTLHHGKPREVRRSIGTLLGQENKERERLTYLWSEKKRKKRKSLIWCWATTAGARVPWVRLTDVVDGRGVV